jgi:SPP1 family predicted phage head-tail adaptor
MIRPADAGKLRHVLTLQQRDTAIGSRGQKASTFATLATIRGAIETLGGREAELARKLSADATLKVTVRYYYPGLTVEHRFLFGSRILNIGHVNNWLQRNEWLICLCAEVS